MGKTGLHGYLYNQCGKSIVSTGRCLHKLKSMTRVNSPPDGINSHISMTNVSLQVRESFLVWPGKAWYLPSLLVQDKVWMNSSSTFSLDMWRGIGQMLRCDLITTSDYVTDDDVWTSNKNLSKLQKLVKELSDLLAKMALSTNTFYKSLCNVYTLYINSSWGCLLNLIRIECFLYFIKLVSKPVITERSTWYYSNFIHLVQITCKSFLDYTDLMWSLFIWIFRWPFSFFHHHFLTQDEFPAIYNYLIKTCKNNLWRLIPPNISNIIL